MTTLFETKKQYFYFRKTWADAVNSPRAKTTKTNYGWLRAEHMILYNILRQRAFDKGFSPITNTNKLENGAYINYGLYNAWNTLSSHIGRAKKIVEADKKGGFLKLKRSTTVSEWDTKYVKDFLEPFAGTVTVKMLAKVELPEVVMLESNYGKGRKVAKLIIASDIRPTTFAQIDEMMKEVA